MKDILQIIQKAMDNAPTEVEKLKLSKSLRGATLLSIEEYNKYKDNIPLLHTCWWLRSPGSRDKYVAIVNGKGNVDADGILADLTDKTGFCLVALRPALKLSNLKYLGLQIGEQFEFVNYGFTIISENLVICNDTFPNVVFRKDGGSNDYETSDIKEYVEGWFNDSLSFYKELNDDIQYRLIKNKTIKEN